MTLKEVQYLIKHIEQGTLEEKEDLRNEREKKDNIQRIVLKLIEEFGELAENIRKNTRFNGKNIKGTIEEEVFDVFYYTIAIANEYGLELDKVFELKDKINQENYEREFSVEEGRENYKKKIYKKSEY